MFLEEMTAAMPPEHKITAMTRVYLLVTGNTTTKVTSATTPPE